MNTTTNPYKEIQRLTETAGSTGDLVVQGVGDQGSGRTVGPRCEHPAMKLLVLGLLLVAATGEFSPIANADPTPEPSPPYVIQSPAGPTVGGMRTLPPICGTGPRACAGNWNPDTGAWDFPPGT
jgi:hypothetical protein